MAQPFSRLAASTCTPPSGQPCWQGTALSRDTHQPPAGRPAPGQRWALPDPAYLTLAPRPQPRGHQPKTSGQPAAHGMARGRPWGWGHQGPGALGMPALPRSPPSVLAGWSTGAPTGPLGERKHQEGPPEDTRTAPWMPGLAREGHGTEDIGPQRSRHVFIVHDSYATSSHHRSNTVPLSYLTL